MRPGRGFQQHRKRSGLFCFGKVDFSHRRSFPPSRAQISTRNLASDRFLIIALEEDAADPAE